MMKSLRYAGLILLVSLTLGAQHVALAQTQQVYRLTLQDAIQRALAANVNTLLANERIAEAEGTRARRYAAAMLPRVNAQTYANVQNRDLQAFGISAPGFPDVVGPFSNYDIRIYGQQNLIDLASYRSLKASERALDSSKLDSQDVRDWIVRSVAEMYLVAESATARASAAQTRVTDAETLLKLATDKHDAGSATGVDVLRAQVQLANEQQALLIAENARKQSLLVLARNLGLSPSVPLELAETLRYAALAPRGPDLLVQDALSTRADYLALMSQRQSLVEQQRANQARWYPKLSLNGNFGGIGRNIGSMRPTGLLQGQVDVPVFDRDRDGEAQELASRVRSIDDRLADMRRGVDEEVREALLNLDSAAQQVEVSEQGQALAQRELALAQDRFQEGTANNVEVVTAQDELARAQENYILAVSSHVDAKFALARALGNTEKNLAAFAQGQ